jgi:UDP-glucose 6-dehydrogenase
VKLAVTGTGYVAVVGACLAENGNEVVGVDKEASWFCMMRTVEERNQAHKTRLLEKMTAHFGGQSGGTIAS